MFWIYILHIGVRKVMYRGLANWADKILIDEIYFLSFCFGNVIETDQIQSSAAFTHIIIYNSYNIKLREH